jgi:hypothetical protein
MTEGVILIHGCGHKMFVSKKSVINSCAIICSGCGGLMELSTFGSTVKAQILARCEDWTEEEIQNSLHSTNKKGVIKNGN